MKAGLTATFFKMLQYFFRVRLPRHRDFVRFPACWFHRSCLSACLSACLRMLCVSRSFGYYVSPDLLLPSDILFFLPRIGRLCLHPLPFVLFPVLVLFVSSLPPLLFVIPLLPFCRFPFLAFSFFCLLPFSSFGSRFTFAVLFLFLCPFPLSRFVLSLPFSLGRHRFLRA